eukprot:8313550-Karenia_brevis.AAC.1
MPNARSRVQSLETKIVVLVTKSALNELLKDPAVGIKDVTKLSRSLVVRILSAVDSKGTVEKGPLHHIGSTKA